MNQLFTGIARRIQTTDNNLPLDLLSTLLGFVVGNAFGLFLPFIRHYLPFDFIIIFLLCVLFEWISAQAYKRASRKVRLASKGNAEARPQAFLRVLNVMKLGILFGFFVDAFKVGS